MPAKYASAAHGLIEPAPREYSKRPPQSALVRSNYVEMPSASPWTGGSGELETGGLAYYWLILSRHKAVWIVFAFAGLLLGFLITLPQTPVYKARGSVEIVDLNQNFLNLKQASPLAENATTSDWDIQTEIKILQSDSLRDRVIAKLRKDSEPEAQAPARVSFWRKALNLPPPTAASGYQQQVIRAANSLKVRASGQTRILEIVVESTYPRLAANFVNTLANEFIEQNLEARWQISEKTGDWLSRQLDEMKIKLERSEDALQGYARNSGLIFTDEKTNISEDKLRQLQQELSAAQAERIAKQSRFELAQSSAPDSLPDILNDAGLRETHSKLTGLREELAELKTTYTPEHVKVKRVEAQIATLEETFAQNRDDILKRIRNEYEEAARREALLSGAYDAQTRVVSGQGEKAIEYNILKREVDTNRQLYEAMLQQLKESSIAAAMHASNIRVLDAAKVPLRPYSPDARRSAALGLLAGVLLGGAFILVRDRLDRTIQQPGDVALYLNVPELGLIPSAGKTANAASTAQPEAGREVSGKGEAIELTTLYHRQSIVADSFRSILVSIFFSGDSSFRPKTLVLTSASPGEGKSTVTSNLAIAIAETGQRVLLIDADLRKPRQHDIFSLDNRRGLSTLLRRGADAVDRDELVAALIRPTEVAGLHLLTSGPPTGAATNLLCDPFVSELLMLVRSDFDVVLIDTPPMLHMPDARILARLADALVLVIRAGHTSRDAALAAHQRFLQDGTRVLGTILNDWDPKHAPSGYYGYEEYYRANQENEATAVA
ncbi:MAG TPA: polysaccharide biosynthesis tyrosine autokinase [Bryobacteraceae bacterium]|nr:polysaccharide biosynthesis tyrosine autokinase [Bryobacteraceae bacterium]